MSIRSSGACDKVAQALLMVMQSVPYVQKTGRYQGQGNWSYLEEAELLKRAREAMIKHGLVLVTSSGVVDSEKRGKGHLTRINYVVRIIHAESGQWLEGEHAGAGWDMSDKDVYKAITGANKYFLAKTLMVPTGDDPESTPESDFSDGDSGPCNEAAHQFLTDLAGQISGSSFKVTMERALGWAMSEGFHRASIMRDMTAYENAMPRSPGGAIDIAAAAMFATRSNRALPPGEFAKEIGHGW